MLQAHVTLLKRSAGPVWLATGLLLVAFGLRVHHAAHDSLWFDEAFTAWMARLPLQEMITRTAHDTAPPLYYAALTGWRALAGEEESTLKMLSILCGMLTVAVSYQIGREAARRPDDPRIGWQSGLAGMLLVTVAWPQIWSSQEIRQYGMAGFLAALSLWAAIRLFNRPERPWLPAAVLAISMGVGLLTHYLFVQVPLVLNLAFVYVFFTSKQRCKLIGAWAAAQAAALAMLVPWLIYSWGILRRGAAPEHPGLWPLVGIYLSVIFAGVEAELGKYVLPRVIGALALIVAGGASLIESRPGRRGGWIALTLSTALPVVLVYVATLPSFNFYRPPTAGRYLVLLSTGVYALLGWGAVALMRLRPTAKNRLIWQMAGIGLLAGLVGLSAWGLTRYYGGLSIKDDYRSLATTLEALRQPGDVVILNNDTDWPVFVYYYPDLVEKLLTQQPIENVEGAEYLLSPFWQSDGVWLVQNRFGVASDPNGYLREALEARATTWRQYAFPEATLYLYALTDQRAAPDRLDQVAQWPAGFVPHDAPLADGVRLAGYAQATSEVNAGDDLVIGLGWQSDAGVTGPWWVAVKIIGTGGAEIASSLVALDAPGAGKHFTPVEILVPPDAPTDPAQVVFISGPNYSPLTTISIRPTGWVATASARLPQAATRLGIRYGEGILLQAAQLPAHTTWHPGESIPLTLYWRPTGLIEERYKVFVHLMGEQTNPATGNNLWGQQDQEPQGGTTQTTRWLPGEVIPDDYLIPIGSDVPAGHYTLQVGLYPLLGGPRLPASNQVGDPLGDSVVIFELEIAP